jgi:UDP-N-acetylmuramate dehydrogenase
MKILQDIRLAPYTTFKVGGNADFFCCVENINDLIIAIDFAHDKKLPILVLGGGSNVLISDNGFRGLVVKTGFLWCEFLNNKSGLSQNSKSVSESNKLEAEDALGETMLVRAGAGVNWDDLVLSCIERGLYGLENLSGIPGSVGACPIQNIGAYGAEVSEFIERVEVFDMQKREEVNFTNSECGFGYRDSIFKTTKGRNLLITSVVFKLKKRGKFNLLYKDLDQYFSGYTSLITLDAVRDAVLRIRARKFPDLNQCGTAGSFFKNPIISTEQFESLKNKIPNIAGYVTENGVKLSSAWLIDVVGGWRGVCDGAVCSYINQALVIVNKGGARAEQIMRFTEKIWNDIKNKTGIVLEHEVNIID